jgi:hypothetical protein
VRVSPHWRFEQVLIMKPHNLLPDPQYSLEGGGSRRGGDISNPCLNNNNSGNDDDDSNNNNDDDNNPNRFVQK